MNTTLLALVEPGTLIRQSIGGPVFEVGVTNRDHLTQLRQVTSPNPDRWVYCHDLEKVEVLPDDFLDEPNRKIPTLLCEVKKGTLVRRAAGGYVFKVDCREGDNCIRMAQVTGPINERWAYWYDQLEVEVLPDDYMEEPMGC